MAEKIQGVPATLLDVLGIKSLGRNPDQLNDAVAGVLDLTEFYLARRIENEQNALGVQSLAGQWTNVTIPQGEIWMVKDFGGEVSNPSLAGAIMGCKLLWEFDDLGTTIQQRLKYSRVHTATSTSIAESTGTNITFDVPRFFLPGTRFRSMLTQTTVIGTVTVRVFVSFYRLSV